MGLVPFKDRSSEPGATGSCWVGLSRPELSNSFKLEKRLWFKHVT